MLHQLARYKDGVFQSFVPLKARKKVIRDTQRRARQTSMGIVFSIWMVDNDGNKIKEIFKVLG